MSDTSASPAVSPRLLLQTCGLPRLEARMLLEHALNRSRSWMLAHDTDPVDPARQTHFLSLVARRLAGEPMAYLVGVREFMGHAFEVAPGVLIPRHDTEVLVETALSCMHEGPVHVLDLGTGSGAIAVSLALARPDARVVGTDVSPAALDIARRNADALGARVDWRLGSWFGALHQDERFDLIVSNPPYIAHDDPHLGQGDLRFEPADALTDGADGLSAIRQLAAGVVQRLNAGGAVWLEHGWNQAAQVRVLLEQAGLHNVASLRDLAGVERITGGCLSQQQTSAP